LLAQSASSSGYALDVDQTVSAVGVADVNVSIGPVAPAGGTAPPAYNNTTTVASVNENIALTGGAMVVSEGLTTQLLSTNATGTATGAEATSTVNDFSLSLAALLSPLFSLSATTIQSYSQANSVGGLDASGMTTIEGLTLSGSVFGSLVFDGGLFINPAPNTVLFNGAGLSIFLNEQIASGDATTGVGIQTNAIRIAFDDFALGTGVKNGNVIIGHTEAFATAAQTGAVPEPSTWAMMLFGFGAVGFAMRRRKDTHATKRLRVSYS
jgi:hypothetical protein